MLSFTKEQIKEISEQLDCGFRAFYHKLSGELIFVPNTDKHFDMETDGWQEELDKLDNNFSDYQEIEAMESRESFDVMAEFAEEVSDKYLRNKLIEALNNKKPFRAFKFTIDNSSERENWFAFKNKRSIEWTEDKLKTQEELNREDNTTQAYSEANQQNWTKEELEDYQRASIKERDEIGRIEFAEKKGQLKEKLEIAKKCYKKECPKMILWTLQDFLTMN